MRTLASMYRIGITTVFCIIHEVCKILWKVLQPIYLKTPNTQDEWLQIAHDFNETFSFPNCIGALDGKHILVQTSGINILSDFNNLVLLAACDAHFNFLFIDIGAYTRSIKNVFRYVNKK